MVEILKKGIKLFLDLPLKFTKPLRWSKTPRTTKKRKQKEEESGKLSIENSRLQATTKVLNVHQGTTSIFIRKWDTKSLQNPI